MKTTLKHEIWIKAPAGKVYQVISTAEGVSTWWDKQRAIEMNGHVVLEHDPGPEHGVVKMKVLDLVNDKRVEWECISTHPSTSPASAWTATHVVFEIARRMVPPWASSKREMTVLQFRHSGWGENNEYLGFCNFAWGQVLEKLKEVCESQQSTQSGSVSEKRKEKRHGNEQGEKYGAAQRKSSKEHTADRIAAGVGCCAPAASREGEGFHPHP